MPRDLTSVSIRPGVSVLSVLKHLNYRPWFALAEFVDNSLQSFLDRKKDLDRLHGNNNKLRVNIELDTTDGGRICIRDNASGIGTVDYPRAFRPAALPPDQSGLCEFGMGMKSASCWFSPYWTVRTSSLGEEVERTLTFDIESIVRDELEELDIGSNPAPPEAHYTEIILTRLYRPPQKRTIGKIKEHLTDIYRIYTRLGLLELYFNGESLVYQLPDVLVCPYYKKPDGEAVKWLKEIDFDFGGNLRVHGFAALRKVGSTSHAGFALFRRNRLIQGSADEGYRPEQIFGNPNSYRYQRLFGELHLEGFEVSHTKDGFKWNENEDIFLEFLKEHLQGTDMPLLQQAEGYRARRAREEVIRGAEIAVERTAEVLLTEAPPVLASLVESTPKSEEAPTALVPVAQTCSKTIEIEFKNKRWRIEIELSNDPAIGDWLEISDKTEINPTKDTHLIVLRLALAHPFMERYGGTDVSQIEPLLRVAAAIGLSEILARQCGAKQAGTIRRNVNELLRGALSKP